MNTTRITTAVERAVLGNTRTPSSQHYLCRACRTHAARQFSTTRPYNADKPWYQRVRETIFGSNESKSAERSRKVNRKRELDNEPRRKAQLATVRGGPNGEIYEIAVNVNPKRQTDYVPATTWTDLESVGSEEWAKKQADTGVQYKGFVPEKQVELTASQWKILIQHLVTEALLLKRAGRNLDHLFNNRSERVNIQRVELRPNHGADLPRIVFPSKTLQRRILAAIDRKAPQAPASLQQTISLRDIQTAKTTMPMNWHGVILTDRALVFAITKRILQLTGHRIPDSVLSDRTTLSSFFRAYQTDPKTIKVAASPEIVELASVAPNVVVHASRRTPIHKDTAVGRWKVIEKELMRRKLPVTGSQWGGVKPQFA